MPSRAEFTVEPFVDGDPGPHVRAAVNAVRELGLTPEIGPFGTVIVGETDAILSAVAALLAAGSAAGAGRISLQIDFDA
jgi:uncharacterized protein YqgV (UPF0045/DUF77 family)